MPVHHSIKSLASAFLMAAATQPNPVQAEVFIDWYGQKILGVAFRNDDGKLKFRACDGNVYDVNQRSLTGTLVTCAHPRYEAPSWPPSEQNVVPKPIGCSYREGSESGERELFGGRLRTGPRPDYSAPAAQ